jgi:chromosome partitioning protein
MKPKKSIREISDHLSITRQGLHKKLKTLGIVPPKEGNTYFIDHETAKNLFQYEFEPKVISVQVVKGGVGKTTLTHSIAVNASLYGAKVLCIDLDQQSNLTLAFDQSNTAKETPVMIDILDGEAPIEDAILSVTNGVDLIPSRMENAGLDNAITLGKKRIDKVIATHINKIKSNYDLILIDCPPSLGPSVCAAALTSDYVICPVTPSEFSISGLSVSQKEMASLSEDYDTEIRIKILLNMHDSRKKSSFETLEYLLSNEKLRENLFKGYVRINQNFENVIQERKSIYENFKTNSMKEDIDIVTKEILSI